ncbi:hypothetical protein SAMN05216487_1397 [Pseudomonas sp. UC 17F4]|uniref:hypothetical protein n=1 Tax=Pseudomonas sp. UC 17F4 TaxID=1855328 RepID=UPI0008864046|nr:hypothetical protein [Pseudomonas sp. UC 17F4]SDQ36564.1 hypothetical protein SAMN05216487_1397 [Pseudomonas sp. UC 17F4]
MSASIKIEPVVELVGAEGTTYYPMKHQQGNAATVKVCYEGLTADDTIRVYWQTVDDEYQSIEVWVEEQGCALFQVSHYLLGLRIAATARIYCEVVRDDETFTSPVSEYSISLRSEDLPETTVLQMTAEGKLDLSLLCCEDPDVYIEPWPFVKVGQRVTRLALMGPSAQFMLYEGDLITAADVAGGWSRKLPLDKLRQFAHGELVFLQLMIQLNPGVSSAHQLFPLKTVTILTEPHLSLSPPAVVEATDCGSGNFVLNPANAVEGATLQVAYENMCCNDRVCATWQGAPGAGTPELECQIVGDSQVVNFRIPPQAISANFNGRVFAAYSVWREGGAWESPQLEIQILDIDVLPTPAVEQSTGRWLDLNTFPGDAVATVEPWDFVEVGQACWLTVTGQLESGGEHTFQVLEGMPLPAEWLANGVSTLLARNELEQLADYSHLQLHFAVNFDGKVDRSTAREFPLLSLQVVQADLQLPAPQVVQAVGNTLTVYNGRDGVTLRVRYERMSSQHSIQPCWRRGDGSCLPITAKPGNPGSGYVDFFVPREAVIVASGKTVKISYTVSRDQKIQVSGVLNLFVTWPVRFPFMSVRQATQGSLELRNFYGHAELNLAAWWFILPGQRVWLRGHGTRQDGTNYNFDVLLNHSVTQAQVTQGLKIVLRRQHLVVLKSLSNLRFTCRVTPDRSSQESAALEFPSLTLLLRSQYENITTFDGGSWNGWVKGPAAQANDMSIRYEGSNATLYNNTHSLYLTGIFLQKEFYGLEVGRVYTFMMNIRQYDNIAPIPQVSVTADNMPVISRTIVAGTSWRQLKGNFTATRDYMHVQLHCHVASATGNDFSMDNLRLTEL